jgi:hypothetical protein
VIRRGEFMRYLVSAQVKPNREKALLRAIQEETLGIGSVAGDEYLCDMRKARLLDDGSVRWVEVCFCPTPLEEERLYWEEYFELEKIKDAHDRRRCRDVNGEEPWACSNCDCTQKLESKLSQKGRGFLEVLQTKK